MLRRSEGATLQQIIEATGWEAHSLRGFISGVVSRQLGLKVRSLRREDGARYCRAIR